MNLSNNDYGIARSVLPGTARQGRCVLRDEAISSLTEGTK